jgi:hypothetical protein
MHRSRCPLSTVAPAVCYSLKMLLHRNKNLKIIKEDIIKIEKALTRNILGQASLSQISSRLVVHFPFSRMINSN